MNFNVAYFNWDVTIEILNNLVLVIAMIILNPARMLYLKTFSWNKFLPKNKTI